MAMENEGHVLTTGSFGGASEGGGSSEAANLGFQHYNTDVEKAGYLGGGTLGRGPRMTQSPNFGFSQSVQPVRNLSAGQFGSGSARDTMGEEGE